GRGGLGPSHELHVLRGHRLRPLLPRDALRPARSQRQGRRRLRPLQGPRRAHTLGGAQGSGLHRRRPQHAAPLRQPSRGPPHAARLRWFGWEVAVVDGHDVTAVREAFARARAAAGRPFGILARTLKGKGVSFLEDKEGWHGKPVKKGDELKKAVAELGDTSV